MSDLVGLETEDRGDVVIARVTGELDLSGAESVGHDIGEAVPTSARALLIDFTNLDFIDSSGVAMLFALSRRLGSRRQELHVAAPPEGPVARVLEIVEFGKAAPIHGTLEEALAALGK